MEALWCHGWFDIVLFTTYLQGDVFGAMRKNKWPSHLFVTTDIGRNRIIMFTGSIDGVINLKLFKLKNKMFRQSLKISFLYFSSRCYKLTIVIVNTGKNKHQIDEEKTREN